MSGGLLAHTWSAARRTLACVPAITPLLGACGGKFENSNRAVFDGLGTGWVEHGLTGEFTVPVYPVKVPVVTYDTTFTAVIRGPRTPAAPYQLYVPNTGTLKFQGARPELLPYKYYYGVFQDDPQYPAKRFWQQTGNYHVGRDGQYQVPHYDIARVIVEYGSGFDRDSGQAILPWMFSSSSTNATGTQAAVVGEEVWVQVAAPLLPQPVNYSWILDGQPLSGVTGGFHATSFNSTGRKEFVITMTGSNGQQTVRTWDVDIVCPNGQIFCDE